MNFSKFSAVVFGVIFIIILYVIIYFALKIMYKDVKNGGRRPRPSNNKKHGLEIIYAEPNSNLKIGSVIPVKSVVTLGRKEDNSIILRDGHVSGYHAKLFIKNNSLFIEDLRSTNGTFVNGVRISGVVKLASKDVVGIGTSKFKVLV